MPLDNEKLKKLYSTLQKGGYKQDYDTFVRGFSGNGNYANRKKVYDLLTANGAQIGGTYEEFMQKMQAPRRTQAKKSPAPWQEVMKGGMVDFDSSWMEGKGSIADYQKAKEEEKKNRNPYDFTRKRTPKPEKSEAVKRHEREYAGQMRDELDYAALTGGKSLNDLHQRRNPLDDYTAVKLKRDDNGDVVVGDDGLPATELTGEAGRVAERVDSQRRGEEARMAAEARKAEQAKLLNEKRRVEKEIADYEKENKDRILDYVKRSDVEGMNVHDMLLLRDRKYAALYAQLDKLNEGLAVALEALKKRDSDSWIDNSSNWFERKGKELAGFGAGALRGLAHAVGKVNTWDLGYRDMNAAGAVLHAAKEADANGVGSLGKEDRDLLDVWAKVSAVEDGNGDLGHGYAAGNITGESLPFMLEMLVNPASGLGKGAQKMVLKQAVKQFGKEAVRREAKKMFGAKIAARVVGDAAGSAVMAGTSGIMRVQADQYNRMAGSAKYRLDDNGEVVYDGREGAENDEVKAFLKAFGAQTIENHSEMIGAYFSPVIRSGAGVLGKGLEKIGLGGVNRFIDEVGATNAAKIVKDIQKKTKWDGTLGEFSEEIVGGVENALLVGDQTVDTAEGTGVFNRDNMIDTFLGVGLLGGFMSAVNYYCPLNF